MAQISLAKIASLVAKIEGKKSQVSIGNIRETIKSLMVLEASMRAIEHFEAEELKGAALHFESAIPSKCFDKIDEEVCKLAEKAYRKEEKRREKEAKSKKV